METLKRLTNRIRSLQEHARLPVSKLCGCEKSSGATINVLYAGAPSQINFIKSVFFAGEPAETRLGSCFAGSLNKLAAKNDCELVIAVQTKGGQSLLPRSGYRLPLWVSADADTTVSPFEISDKSLKADLARMRKNDLTCEHSTSVKDLEYFWDHMYVPHIRSQHGDQAILDSIDEFLDFVAEGQLLVTFAIHKGRRIAGGTLTTEDQVPRSRHIGLLNGNESLRQLGSMTAVYVYELDWACRNGYKKINLGGSRPFFTNGIFQYKKKFNISLRNGDHKKVIYINPLTRSVAVTSALASNPMIGIDQNDLVALVFDGDDVVNSEIGSPWLHHGQLMLGLRELQHVYLSE